MIVAQLLQELAPVHFRHDVINQHQIELFASQHFQTFAPAESVVKGMAFAIKCAFDQFV